MDGWNYFNYFTEIEEYFWKKRGAHLLVSPLDWAIMETWQKAGVPLEAVLKGIDSAFESYGRSRRGAGKPLKSRKPPRAPRRKQKSPPQSHSLATNCAPISIATSNKSQPRLKNRCPP